MSSSERDDPGAGTGPGAASGPDSPGDGASGAAQRPRVTSPDGGGVVRRPGSSSSDRERDRRRSGASSGVGAAGGEESKFCPSCTPCAELIKQGMEKSAQDFYSDV